MIDRMLGRFAQCSRFAIGAGDGRFAVQAHEPLRRGEEDDRVVTAPAVRVLVFEGFAMP